MLETPRKRKVSDGTDRKRRTKQPRVSFIMASSVENVQADNSLLDEDDEGLPATPFLPRMLRTEQRNTSSAASSQPSNRTIVNLSDSSLTEEPSIVVMNETSNLFFFFCTEYVCALCTLLYRDVWSLGGWHYIASWRFSTITLVTDRVQKFSVKSIMLIISPLYKYCIYTFVLVWCMWASCHAGVQ